MLSDGPVINSSWLVCFAIDLFICLSVCLFVGLEAMGSEHRKQQESPVRPSHVLRNGAQVEPFLIASISGPSWALTWANVAIILQVIISYNVSLLDMATAAAMSCLHKLQDIWPSQKPSVSALLQRGWMRSIQINRAKLDWYRQCWW